MIISYKYKFIFLHCRKTAGSSITVALSRYLGRNDIQLGALEETFSSGYRPPINSLARGVFNMAAHPLRSSIAARRNGMSHAIAMAIKRSYQKKIGAQPQHAFAKEVRNVFPVEWAGFHKFCVVRNPYEKVVSDYYWRTGTMTSPPSFSEFVRILYENDTKNANVLPKRPDNWPIYTIDDKPVVDSVVRYENLQIQLRRVMDVLGVPWDGNLPHAKARKGG